MSSKHFKVSDPLLLQAIRGETPCDKFPLNGYGGYLYRDDRNIGRAFLEYCYCVIFGIHRFPGYESRYSVSASECSWLVESGIIEESDVLAACRELRDLYDFIQKSLAPGEAKLYRALNAEEIGSARRKGGEIVFQTNILTSYTSDPELYNHLDVKIAVSVDPGDILMIDTLTEFPVRGNECCYRAITGEHEVWVLNRNRFGETTIPIDSVITDKCGFVDNLKEQRRVNRIFHGPDCSLEDSYTSPIKPCELTWFSRWLTKRNMERIRKQIL